MSASPSCPRQLNRRHAAALAALALFAPLAAACGSSTPAKSSAATHGTASVACAGSLDKLYHGTFGPAFERATGDRFGGPPCAGSTALASEITSGEIHPGVFLSVGAKAIKKLWPTRSKFAIVLATDPLVVAYSPKSRYASQLNAIRSGREPLSHLFQLFQAGGFKLGRTDPAQDPQGTFFILMVKLATSELHLPGSTPAKALGLTPANPSGTTSQIFSEDALPTDIGTGIVDAGSEYLSQALQYHLDYITLPAGLDFAHPADTSKYASVSTVVAGATVPGELITLDVTTVTPGNGPPVSAADSAADDAFIAYLLSPGGRRVLAKAGYSLETPVLKVPASSDTPGSVLPPSVLKAFTALHGTVSTS